LNKRLLNVKEASVYLGVTVFFMRTLAWDKRVPKLRLGQRDLFDVQDLDAFVAAEKTKQAA
jgi:excisionase family DNA binding protein